ncbi:MAG TPA: cytochrome c peroxidase [Allosphingosinicella sp.]
MFFKPALLAAVLAVSLGAAPAAPERWSPDELELLRSLSIDSLEPLPSDPSNKVADDPRTAELGRLLFSDGRLSANGKVSCASCHDPAHGFTDRTATGRGVGTGTRRTMPIAPAVYAPWQFWDGRADSLWAQALGPIENPAEHGFTRGEVASAIRTRYAGRYTALFGPLPNLRGERASPLGDRAARRRWAAMPIEQREAVDRVFANAGKAIAAFERLQPVPETRFDLYVRWLGSGSREASPLSSTEVAGLRIFTGKGGCTSCHSGPLLTNNEFANTGVPATRGAPLDRGRIGGIGKAFADPFNCRGNFSDDPERRCPELDFAVAGSEEQVRAFKVPSLRGVALRQPYMHAGQLRTLDAVVRHYSAAPKAPAGQSQLKPLRLKAAERRRLVAFLKTLNPVVLASAHEKEQQ